MNNRPNENFLQKRLKNLTNFNFLIGIILIAAIGILICRFFIISTTKHVDGHNLNQASRDQFFKTSLTQGPRGKIYDKSGKVLADNSTTYDLYAVLDKNQKIGDKPLYVKDKQTTAAKLSQVIDLSAEEILAKLNTDAFQVEFGNPGKQLSIAQRDQIAKMNLPGINFTESASRIYPYGVFASHIIGLAQQKEEKQSDETKLTGLMGIERAQNKLLSGKEGFTQLTNSAEGYTQDVNSTGTAPQSGDDVYLTLDASLQQQLENQMTELYDSTEADSAFGVLMDAKTGQVLAGTQRPTFDGTTRENIDQLWQNLLTESAFEPGSTMKAITLAAAIDTDNWHPNQTFQSGRLEIDGAVINDYENDMGEITFREGFARSSNVAFAKVEQTLGKNTWRKYIEGFGFLKPVGFGLPNEAAGSIQWERRLEQVNTAFGQAIDVTPVQMLQAYSAFANDGKMVKPHIVDKIVNRDSKEIVKEEKTTVTGQPIQASTAKKVLSAMEDVVNMENGTAKAYSLKDEGYRIAAKTGTAQIAAEDGYTNDLKQAVHSVVVMAPADDPQFIFYVAVNSPQEFPDGTIDLSINKVVKPILLEALNNSKSAVKSDQNLIEIPDFTDQSIDQAEQFAEDAGLQLVVIGDQDRKITNQNLNPQSKVITNQKLIVITDTKDKNQLLIPDLTDWSLSQVNDLAELVGGKVKFSGSGYVTSQQPAAGEPITKDIIINIGLQ